MFHKLSKFTIHLDGHLFLRSKYSHIKLTVKQGFALYLSNDIGRLEFANGFDVLRYGPVVVAFVVEVISVLAEDVNHSVLIVLLRLR